MWEGKSSPHDPVLARSACTAILVCLHFSPAHMVTANECKICNTGKDNKLLGTQFCPWCPLFFIWLRFGRMLCFWRISFAISPIFGAFCPGFHSSTLPVSLYPLCQDTLTSFLKLSPLFIVALLYYSFLLRLLLFLLLSVLWLQSCVAFEQSALTLLFPISPIISVNNFAQHTASQEGFMSHYGSNTCIYSYFYR